MYQECIEFPMEVCQNTNENPINTEDMYRSLAILHKLRIVHQDIKPDNIMFSPSKKKMVFVDFGLSQIIQEELGKQTITSYVGSINFCCLEMKNCFNSKTNGYVDLYYNDLFCLEGSIEQIKSSLEY